MIRKLILISLILLVGSICKAQKLFKEIILDSAAPRMLWMKTIGDINNDQKTDIIVGGWQEGGIVAYLAPNWKKISIKKDISVSTDGEVDDINRDGLNDLVVVAAHALVWLQAPTWTIHVIDSLELHDIEVADLDKDGLIDIVARNQGEWGYKGDKVFIYKQLKNGNFLKDSITIPNGEGLKLADINNDGRKDIIVNKYWFENTGNIKKRIPHLYSNTWNWSNTFIDVADVNNDGRFDILLSPSELEKQQYHFSWFEAPKNRSNLWKENIVEDSIETVRHFIGAADFNMDGKMDIMTAQMQQGRAPHDVAVYLQQKNKKFKKEVISVNGNHSIRLFDCDGDGDIDAFGANHAKNIVRLYINQTINK